MKRLRGAVRQLESGISFVLEGEGAWPGHQQFFDAVPSLTELWWQPEGKRRRLLHTRAEQRQAGASFTQVNPGVAAALRSRVLELASAIEPRTVVDAYAGTGDIAVALAAKGANVAAIEVDADAARLCASRLPSDSRVIASPVEDAIQDVLPADLVILNPPRAGVDARVTQALVDVPRKPRAILYVSCNPATLARDVRRLESYTVRSVRGFDMFPQTAHVETVCELVPTE
jgi:23S rRNA (uracil1939-C5)-methyltransferase